jgi:hypothetical protein
VLVPIFWLIKLNTLIIIKKKRKRFKKNEMWHTSWSSHNQLIKSKAFATGFDDSCPSGLSKSEGANRQLWNIKKSIVISNSAYTNRNFVSIIVIVENNLLTILHILQAWTMKVEVYSLWKRRVFSRLSCRKRSLFFWIGIWRAIDRKFHYNKFWSAYLDKKMNV